VTAKQLLHQVPVISSEVEISPDFQKFIRHADISTSLDMTFEKRHCHDTQQPLVIRDWRIVGQARNDDVRQFYMHQIHPVFGKNV
jgi:hypothetical protein